MTSSSPLQFSGLNINYPKPLIIGLTGLIGSGKSTVASYFSQLGIDVFDADQIVAELSAKGETGYQAILAHFGSGWLDSRGNLDRSKMREAVFGNKNQRQQLESLLHPLVYKRLQVLTEIATSAYVIWDVPLLVGSAGEQEVDRILVVDAPVENRIKWIQQRNDWDTTLIKQIMASQRSPNELLEKADDVIENAHTLASLEKKVANLHKRYADIAASARSSSE